MGRRRKSAGIEGELGYLGGVNPGEVAVRRMFLRDTLARRCKKRCAKKCLLPIFSHFGTLPKEKTPFFACVGQGFGGLEYFSCLVVAPFEARTFAIL